MTPADPALAAPLPAPCATPDGAPTPARALIDAQLAMLSRLAQIGMEIAEDCGREAKAMAAARAAGDGAASPAAHPRDPGLTFARVARAVRMTIALQSRLMKDLAALDWDEDMAEQANRDRRRMRLRQLTQQAAEARIEAQIDAGRLFSGEDAIEDEIERLGAEAYERLTDAEDGFCLDRPFAEMVAGICADLGLSPQWSERILAATAAPAGPPGGLDDLRRTLASARRTTDPPPEPVGAGPEGRPPGGAPGEQGLWREQRHADSS